MARLTQQIWLGIALWVGSIHPSFGAPLSLEVQKARVKAGYDRTNRVSALRSAGVRAIPENRFEQTLLLLHAAKQSSERLDMLQDVPFVERARVAVLAQRKLSHDTKAQKKSDARQLREERLAHAGRFAPAMDLTHETKLSNPEMPAFSALVQQLGGKKTLAGFKIIGIQHLLGSTGGLARALTASGARAEDTMLLGKMYSQNEHVMNELSADGFQIHESRSEPDLSSSWGRGPKNRQSEILNALDEITGGGHGHPVDRSHRYLVIDDGGDLLEQINEHYPQLHDRIVGVEQTTRGIRKLEKMNLNFPVVTVGDAVEKTEHESPMIGRSLALIGDKRLDRIRKQGYDLGREILIVGAAGSVGRAAVKAYKQLGYHVRIYDTRTAEAAALAKAEGVELEPTFDGALSRAKVLLSLTGTQTIGDRELELLPHGAILMNGASSATEIKEQELPDSPQVEFVGPAFLKIVQLRMANTLDDAYDRQVRVFAGRNLDIGGQRPLSGFGVRSQHDVIMRLASGKELLLVNQGQVINFEANASVDPIPPRYIQLTRGLLYMAAIQAAKTSTPGMHKLDPAAARTYRETVDHDLARTHESLTTPTFQ